MTKDEILAACDAKATQWLPTLTGHTNSHHQSTGVYWQGLRTHSVIPADGDEQRPDIGTKSPSTQPVPWPPTLRGALLPMAITVDVYDGPEGQGYTALLEVVIAGQTWRRVEHVGPENWRASAWAVLPPPPPGYLP